MSASTNPARTLAAVWVGLLFVQVGWAAESAPAASAATRLMARSTAPKPKLDLRPPRIEDLYSPAQIAQILSKSFDPNMEEVEVEGIRPGNIPMPVTPDIPGGLGSLFWAIANPLQSWRIFAPLPPDRTNAMTTNLDATRPYRPPAAQMPRNATDFP